MRKLTILVDMDDTIEDLLTPWLEHLNKKYGTNVRRYDVSDWNLTKAFPLLTARQVYAPLYDDTLWRNVIPIDGAKEALHRLMRDGHDIYIVTSSNYQTLSVKMEEVLFKYFPFLSWDNVIIASNKQIINGDVMIDDGVHNLIGGGYIKLLFDAPHNREFDAEGNGMIRVYNWGQIYTMLCAIAEV